MKKYAIILLILTLVGVGLTVLLFTQDEKLDQTVFINTTESIRNLQNLDKKLLLLLNQSRFNSEFEHDTLLETSYQLSEEFSNLRYDALFEEIESSEGLSVAVKNFDEHYSSREEELELYAQANQTVSAALGQLLATTQAIQTQDLKQASPTINDLLGKINAQIFSMGLLNRAIANQTIMNQLNELMVESPTASLNVLDEYKVLVISILNNNNEATASFNTLSELNTGALLDAIEKEYVNYHNQAIQGSTLFRNALITYGVILLSALIFFAAQIRRNYLFLEQEVADRTQEIKDAYQELQESQEQLIQSEKMASLGQMVAGVAHEINTPLGYVSSNVETLKFNVDDLTSVLDDLGELLSLVTKSNRDNKAITQQMMQVLKQYRALDAHELTAENTQLLEDGIYGLGEISKLVSSLKDFARLDRQASEQVNVHDCINSSLTIASNHIRENNVTVIKQYNDLPNIACTPSKLNQLFLNIITNACQSMSKLGGNLIVSSALDGDRIRLKFQDQGQGMNEATQQKMFDPFFTTKDIGVGTGLGMSIAYKIIEAHKGTIEVDSTLGEGTTLSVTLPVA